MSTAPGAPERRPSLLARFWPIAVTIAIFVAIFLRIPFDLFWEAVQGARLVPFFGLMAIFSLCFFAMDTFVLCTMLRWFHGWIGYRELLPVRATTYLVSIVNTQLAQGALAYYVHRRFGTPLGQIAGTVGVIILLEATQLILWATVGMMAFFSEVPPGLLWTPVALAALWALLVATAHGQLGALSEKVSGNVLFQTFRRAHAWQFVTILLLKAPVFLLSLVIHSFALPLFGVDIPFVRLLAFLPIVYMVSALPVTVAHLGTSQAAWIFFFRDYAAEADLLAYSLVSHLTFMLANGSLGLLFLPKAYSDLFLERRTDDIASRAAG